MTEGTVIEHDWKSATCTEPKTCRICGLMEGAAKGHNMIAATCMSPRKCSNCGYTEGYSLGHDVEEYICKRCGTTFISKADVPNILDITQFSYKINSVGGINIYVKFKNKSSKKTINYIYLTLAFKNAVGDIIYDDISKKDSTLLQFTGPLSPGKTTSESVWEACFYNNSFSGDVKILEAQIHYSDGTKLILDNSLASEMVVGWRK